MKLLITLAILSITSLMILEANQLKDIESRMPNPCIMTSTGLECKLVPDYEFIGHNEAIKLCEELSLTYDYEATGIHPMDFCK